MGPGASAAPAQTSSLVVHGTARHTAAAAAPRPIVAQECINNRKPAGGGAARARGAAGRAVPRWPRSSSGLRGSGGVPRPRDASPGRWVATPPRPHTGRGGGGLRPRCLHVIGGARGPLVQQSNNHEFARGALLATRGPGVWPGGGGQGPRGEPPAACRSRGARGHSPTERARTPNTTSNGTGAGARHRRRAGPKAHGAPPSPVAPRSAPCWQGVEGGVAVRHR